MNRIVIVLILSILVLSCRKDPIIPPPELPIQTPTLVNSPGSYFVYQWYEIDSAGVETMMDFIDTVRVIGDSLINGNEYTYLQGSYWLYQEQNTFLRDSVGYIINNHGVVMYSYYQDYDTVLHFQGTLQSQYRVNVFDDDIGYTLPDGQFKGEYVSGKEVRFFDHQVHFYDNYQPYTVCDSVWVSHNFYIDGIGEVMSQSGYAFELHSQCRYRERRLIYYDITNNEKFNFDWCRFSVYS